MKMGKENGIIPSTHKCVFFFPQAARCSHHVINSYKTPEWEEANIEGWYFFLSLNSFQKFKNWDLVKDRDWAKVLL